jgi:hypothetical protein
LEEALKQLHDSLWKGGRYLTPGGELSLLYTFHLLNNKSPGGVALYETDYSTRTFNTIAEYESIKGEFFNE